MPQVIPALATYFGVAAANTAAAIGASAALTASVYVAASTAFVYATDIFLLNKALGILNKRGKTGETRGLEVALTDSTASARVIYGEVRCSGVNIIPPVTSGSDGRYMHQILAFAVHEIDSYQTHYFEQDTLPTPASITGATGDGAISSGTYSGAAWVRGYTGTMTQTVDWKLNNAFSSQWLSTARGRGFAYVAYTYDWGKGKVYKGVPQPTAKVRGAKVYDPRLDSTNGGSGSQRYTDTTTWTYSNNPALCWANYRIAAYGYGNDPATEVNWTTVAAAADICDALVANKDGTTSKRYTCNGVLINEPENLQDNEQKLIDSMLGRRTFVNGQWCIYAGAWTTPAWSIAATDWLSIESIDTVQGFEQGGRFNEVHCFFVNPSRNWQRVECYPRLNATYKSDDAGRSLPLEMEQPLCTDESEAQRKAEFILRASRNGIKLVGTLPPRFHGIKTYETVSLTFAELGWSSKTFRVIAMSLFMDGSVRVALSEEQDTDWTDLVLADYNSPSLAAIPAVNPTTPTAVTALTLTPRPGAIEAFWDEPVVRPVNSFFRLKYASVNSYDVSSLAWEGDALKTVITRADTATNYYWLDSVAVTGSYQTFPGVSSGVAGYGLLTDTSNMAPNAATYVTQVGCAITQVFSKGSGAYFGFTPIGRVDVAAQAGDATVLVTANLRVGLGNIFALNEMYLKFVTGVSSIYTTDSVAITGAAADMRQAILQGKFAYTANNSAYVEIFWNTNSGPNSFTFDNVQITAEFIKR